ncbi:MAG: sigma factor-like helix-turn-helix DNA-binding protein [Frankiaceae bacterium]
MPAPAPVNLWAADASLGHGTSDARRRGPAREGTTPRDRTRADAPPADALHALFTGHFRGLVRLASLLGADDPEDVVQESFARLHRTAGRLRDPGAALPYLRSTVVNLCRSLPGRQREVLVLRYWLDLSEAEIADAMGISRGAVKSHAARAIAALERTMEARS